MSTPIEVDRKARELNVSRAEAKRVLAASEKVADAKKPAL